VLALAAQPRAADTVDGDMLGRPIGGYRALPLHLAKQLAAAAERHDGAPDRARPPLRLGTVVARVRWRPGGVQIEARAADGVALPPLRARLAIVTVPLGVLQAPAGATGAIRFDPPLPHATRAAIQAL